MPEMTKTLGWGKNDWRNVSALPKNRQWPSAEGCFTVGRRRPEKRSRRPLKDRCVGRQATMTRQNEDAGGPWRWMTGGEIRQRRMTRPSDIGRVAWWTGSTPAP